MLHGVKINNDNSHKETPASIGIPGLLVILSIIYNAVLAFVNINIMQVGMVHVAIAEFAILSIGISYVALNNKKLVHPSPHFLFLFIIILFATLVMVANGEFYIKIIRDMFIVVFFVLLGTLMERQSLIKTFKILTLLTLGVLCIEIIASETYLNLFNPASYYQNTRGIEPFMDSKYFRNAITAESRFSYNFISDVRTSSLFLEQVSLANFSMVLMIFVTSFWKNLTRNEALFFVFSIILFVLTNDSRTASALIILLWLGYYFFPKLPKQAFVLILPALILMSVAFFYDPSMTGQGLTSDDLKGRFGLTVGKLSELDFKTAYLGSLGNSITSTGDSGYAYIIYATTLFGLIAFWLYTAVLMSPGNLENARRYAYAASIFIAVNLMIGAAIFSIKVAAILWLLAGYFYKQSYEKKLTEKKQLF